MLGRLGSLQGQLCRGRPAPPQTRVPPPAAGCLWGAQPSTSCSRRSFAHAEQSGARPQQQRRQQQWGRQRARGRGHLLVAAAMFDGLSASLQKAWKGLNADGRLSAENIKEPLRDIRRALLEADVSLPVVRRFVKRVEEKVLGVEVLGGVTPQVQFVKCVNDELVALMGGGGEGGGARDLEPPARQGEPQVVLMAGLQGVGKTTACGKLALLLTKRRKKVLMVATDVYRPAAIDQLVKLGNAIDVPVFEMGSDADPVDIARQGVARGVELGVDAVIVDTAGRLQINADMMTELRRIKSEVAPSDTLLVVDAMTGQEAATLVKAFNDEVDISGAILTKMDGDSRGGAALSVHEVSGRPVKFVGTGEKMEALEPFYPDRMAQRILGMGDMLTLYEKAQDAIKEEEVAAFKRRMELNKFDFNDFLQQWKQVNNMGGMQMMKLMPGFNQITEKQLYEAEKKFKAFEALIASMTAEERESPELLIKSPARRRRIAEGAGRSEAEVQEMLAQFTTMRQQMGKMNLFMRMQGGSGSDPQQLAKELIKSAQVPVSPGKVRRRRDKAPSAPRAPALDKSKGFGR